MSDTPFARFEAALAANPPRKSKVTTTISIRKDLLKRGREEAVEKGQSFSAWLEDRVAEKLAK